MQLTIRSITRGVLFGALPGAAMLSLALLSNSALGQSGSGSSSSQSSGSSSSSGQSESDTEKSRSQSSSQREQESERSDQSERSQDSQSRRSRGQQEDSQSQQSDSSQRQRSSSGLGQSNRDRQSDSTDSQQRRSSSQQSQDDRQQSGQRQQSRQRQQYDDDQQSDQSQSSQRNRGLGQTNRDRQEDDYSRQQDRSRSYSQDDERSYGQSQRQRSGSRSRDSQYQDDQYSEDRRSRQSDDDRSRQRSFSQDQRSTRSASQRQLGLSFSSSQDDGLVISSINPQSVAATAGLRAGDEIVAINGRRIDSREEFTDWIQSSQGSRLNVLVHRNGREIPVTLTTTDRNWQSQGFAQEEYDYARDSEYSSRASLGVVLDPRYQQGAMVDRVYRDSPAEEAGLQRGDYIIAVDGQRINSPQDLVRIISRMEPGSDIELEFTRRQRDSTSVTLGSQGDRQDGSFSLTQERRSSSSQRSAGRQQFEDEDEFRD